MCTVAKGGGQNKKDPKGRGRPSGETPRSVIGYIMSIDTTVMPSQDSNPTCFNPSSHTDTLTCCICLGLLNRPVQLSCDNLICANCCCESIPQSHSLDCPCCNTHTLSQSTISKPSAIVLSFLNEVIVSCFRQLKFAIMNIILLVIAKVSMNTLILLQTSPCMMS